MDSKNKFQINFVKNNWHTIITKIKINKNKEDANLGHLILFLHMVEEYN